MEPDGAAARAKHAVAKQPLKIAILTGEASGDRVGAGLAEEVRHLCPDAQIWGIGGKHMRQAGVEIFQDTSRWGTVGVAAIVKLLPRLLALRTALKRELLRRPPDVLVPVDAGGFNLGFGPMEGMTPWARRNLPQTRILYYFPPGSWRRILKGSSLARVTDKVVTPFPWSEEQLRRFGVDASFVGHPLLDLVHPSEAPPVFAERYGVDLEHPVVGVLPGSRPQEIAHILPVQLRAAAIIHRRVPGVQFLVALAPTVDRAEVIRHVERVRRDMARERELEQEAEDADQALDSGLPPLVTTEGTLIPPDQVRKARKDWLKRVDERRGEDDFRLAIVEDATYDVMAASDVLITTSGTATLEAAILGKPMVIVYRMSRLNAPEMWLIRKSLPPHIGLPNLLADRRICPELVQDAATPEAIAQEIIDLLLQPERLLRMRNDLKTAVKLLGEPGGAARAARLVVELAQTAPREQATDAGA